MTQDDKITDIIDIDPEQIIESKIEDSGAPKAKSRRKYGVYGLTIAALLTSAAAGGWFYRDVLSTYFPSNQIHTIVARVDAVELANKQMAQKLDAVVGLTDEIKSQLSAAQTAANDARAQATNLKTDSSDIKNKLATLEKSLGLAKSGIDELRSKIASGAPATGSIDVSGLTSRIDKLESDLTASIKSNVNSKPLTSQLSQSLETLKAKIAIGSIFETELKSMSQMIPSAEGLDVLAVNAPKEIMTAQALSEKLKNFAATAKPPEAIPAAQDDSWWGRTTNLFSGLVTVKTTGAVDWSQIAKQGADLIDHNQLADALKLLEQNLDSMPQPLQEWRVNASRRIAVDQALEQLTRAVSREIAARG